MSAFMWDTQPAFDWKVNLGNNLLLFINYRKIDAGIGYSLNNFSGGQNRIYADKCRRIKS
jgi:hypothetical protein